MGEVIENVLNELYESSNKETLLLDHNNIVFTQEEFENALTSEIAIARNIQSSQHKTNTYYRY